MPAMRKLMVTTGNGTVAHELADGLTTLGRSPENLVVIDDPSVSSRHAELKLANDSCHLKDLDSTNGTLVNGQAITSVVLRAGDRIRFGKVEACFECENPGNGQPLPMPAEMEAKLAEVSVRPADFENASPFPHRKTQRDLIRTALFAAVVLAILAFLGSMVALLQMQPPAP